MPVSLELAIADMAGARIAETIHADRVEVRAAVGANGGLTPSLGLVAAVLEHVDLPVHVVIRPHLGHWVWSADDIAVQVRDIRAFIQLGVRGVVVGALTASRTLDAEAIAMMCSAADGREVTFHRAFDQVHDPLSAIQRLADWGVTRVLTSGGMPRCIDGLGAITLLSQQAAGGIQIQASGGVRSVDIPRLVAAGVDAIHVSASRQLVADGGPGGELSTVHITDEILASEARRVLDECLGTQVVADDGSTH